MEILFRDIRLSGMTTEAKAKMQHLSANDHYILTQFSHTVVCIPIDISILLTNAKPTRNLSGKGLNSFHFDPNSVYLVRLPCAI